MSSGDSHTILADFAAGNFPIAIVGTHPGDEYPCLELWQDELVLIAHPEVCAELGSNPQLTELLSFPFIARGGSSGSQRSVHAALENHGISPARMRIVLEVSGNEALKAAVMNRIGLGFISEWAIRREVQSGSLKVLPLPNLKILRQFYAVCRQPLAPICLQLFWDFLDSQASPAK